MGSLSGLALRNLFARPVRSLLSAVAVALGVGILLAVLATDAGIAAAAARTVADLIGRSDARVTALDADDGLDERTVRTIGGAAPVALAAPVVERRTFLLPTPEGPGPRSPQDAVTVLGIDPLVHPRLHDLPLVAGVALGADTSASALVSETLARAAGVGLGDSIRLVGAAASAPRMFRIIGLLAGDGPVIGAAGRVVVVPIGSARALFDLPGATAVDVALRPGTTVADLVRELDARLEHPYVLTTPADAEASLRASTAGFRSTAALVGIVVLFVAAFLIFNTLSMTVAERTREVGLLRAAGATGGQIHRLVLAEAAALGLAGSVLGLAVGAAAAAAMAGYVRTIEGIPLDDLVVPPAALALALGLGFATTVGAGIEPAFRASRIPPVEALRPAHVAATLEPARLRWLLVVFAVVGATGLVLVPPAGPLEAVAAPVLPLAVYGQLLLLALAVPFLVGPLGVLAGVLLRGPLRTEERLARGALVRDASRTALTVGALAIGLAMIVAIRTVADTARAAGSAWLEEVVPGELILSSIRPVGLDEGIASEIAAIDGVARVSPIATLDVAYRGVRLSAVAVVGADLAADGRLAFVAGDRAAALAALDAGGAAIVPESLARTLGLRVGDRLEVRAAERAVSLTVAGIVARSFAGRAGESVLVGWPDALGGLGVRGADVFAVRFAPGRTDARPEVERVARSLALQPATLDAVRSAIGDALGRLFGLFDALGLIAVAVGGLGVANTFAMSVRERIREIAILRATGMTRRQVGRMVVVEAAILGVVGTVLGAVGGTSVAAAIVLLGGAGLGAGPGAGLGPSPGAVLGAAVVGIVVPVVAATYPARIAAGIPIVRGVRAE